MTQAALAQADDRTRPMTAQERRVVFASSAGTIFEWYDFYLYGSMAGIIAKHFFSNVNPTAGYIFALLAFAVGFAVRPLGALVFGRLGDLVGRKYTFLITILIMGISTFLVGLLPTFAAIGFMAPILLIVLRLLQGLALGGEYGGAAIFVGEHAPQRRRGYYTSWIQTTATLGLLLSLLVIMGLRCADRRRGFRNLGLALPVPAVLRPAGRLGLDAPAAQRNPGLPPDEGAGARLARSGLRSLRQMGQRQDRADRAARRHRRPGRGLVHGPVLRAVLPDPHPEGGRRHGQLADRRVAHSRRALLPVLRLAVGQDRPQADHPRRLPARRPALFPDLPRPDHHRQPGAGAGAGDRSGDRDRRSGAMLLPVRSDRERRFRHLLRPRQERARQFRGELHQCRGAGGLDRADHDRRQGDRLIRRTRPAEGPAGARSAPLSRPRFWRAIAAAGYPAAADPAQINKPGGARPADASGHLVAMVYGPIAAQLVELFPTRIRYTSVSLPYHIGNGWFGGFLPPLAFAMVAASGNIYFGLWYPVCVALMTFVDRPVAGAGNQGPEHLRQRLTRRDGTEKPGRPPRMRRAPCARRVGLVANRRRVPNGKAGLAQLVEQLICNQ